MMLFFNSADSRVNSSKAVHVGFERKVGIRKYLRKVFFQTFLELFLSTFPGVETLSVFEPAGSRLGRK